ncbi:MAG: hypothetical protein J0M18_04885 [Ignavibacteria bacterium]|nr:hypothetical protein [Ignavibacteria bacterium]
MPILFLASQGCQKSSEQPQNTPEGPKVFVFGKANSGIWGNEKCMDSDSEPQCEGLNINDIEIERIWLKRVGQTAHTVPKLASYYIEKNPELEALMPHNLNSSRPDNLDTIESTEIWTKNMTKVVRHGFSRDSAVLAMSVLELNENGPYFEIRRTTETYRQLAEGDRRLWISQIHPDTFGEMRKRVLNLEMDNLENISRTWNQSGKKNK